MSLPLSLLEPLLLVGGFALGLGLAVATGGARFCIYGALSDVARRRPSARLSAWLVAIAAAILGTAALQAAGLIDTSRSLYASPRLLWASHFVGGVLFGAGMVLAEGCGLRNLGKSGAGDVDAGLALLAAALFAFMTMKGILALPRLHGLDTLALELPGAQTLDALLVRAGVPGAGPAAIALALGALAALRLLRRTSGDPVSPEVLWRGGAVGFLVVAGWWLSGVVGHLPEHPQTLEETFLRTASGRVESLAFVGPLAHGLEWLLWWTDESRRLTIGITVALGVVAGSAFIQRGQPAASGSGNDAGRTRRHLAGGALMGAGGVAALGCSVGQGITGLSTLSLGSLIAVAGIVSGALLALRQRPESGCSA